jgi:hypothetical protein
VTPEAELQYLRSRCATLKIQISIIEDILEEDFDREDTSAITEEYWNGLHDKVLALKRSSQIKKTNPLDIKTSGRYNKPCEHKCVQEFTGTCLDCGCNIFG